MYYFVSESTGDDGNVGNFDAPFKTIQKGLNSTIPNDTVYARQGEYQERVVFGRSGEDKAPIMLSGYPGERPNIEATEVAINPGDGAIFINSKSHIEIADFGIANSAYGGIWAVDPSDLIIRNVKTFNTVSAGLWIRRGRRILLDGNEVERACIGNPDSGIVVADTEDFEVKRNHVHDMGPGDNGGECIAILRACANGRIYQNNIHGARSVPLYISAGDLVARDIEAYLNACHDNEFGGIALACERVSR